MQTDITFQELIDFLLNINGFKEVDPAVLGQKIVPMLSLVQYEANDQIICKGRDSGTLYLLFKGQIRVEISAMGDARSIILNPGAILGEMSLVSNKPAVANVFAHTHADVLTLDVETFRDIMQDNNDMTRAFAFMVGQRIADFVKLKK
ncbi:MAG: cyclic nucleotide-binding domain-containing protein [Magnetococcus sp. DMHC-1]|nr:cyclic nucleotide-binding domain-containing protein [Magnetococcales bacterium]